MDSHAILRNVLKVLTRVLVRPFRRRRPPSKTVAILVPMSTRPDLTEVERISMRHLLHYLGSYDKYLLAPSGMKFEINGFKTQFFSRKFFGSAAAHGKLLGTRAFYKRFLDYDYIFFYHLDSLVFSDQLGAWCARGLDYIGPPWICCKETPWVDRPRVGNGGFTLLRVENALKALTNRYLNQPSSFWLDLFTMWAPRWLIRLLKKLEVKFPNSRIIACLVWEWRAVENPAALRRNNDIFWSDMAVRYLPEFKVASLEEGLRFAFEAAPRTCMEMSGGNVPFGCHAWERYDRAFWMDYLLGAHPSESLKTATRR